jgi:hypothetical protein
VCAHSHAQTFMLAPSLRKYADSAFVFFLTCI